MYYTVYLLLQCEEDQIKFKDIICERSILILL